jgi:ribosomal protein S18 acetylase RimI-like enzyme
LIDAYEKCGLAVIQDSAARIFYERLGFYKTGEIDGRLSMEWKAIEVSSR